MVIDLRGCSESGLVSVRRWLSHRMLDWAWNRAVSSIRSGGVWVCGFQGFSLVFDIALSSAPEVTSSYVTIWVRVGVNRAQALYDTIVSSMFHLLPFVSIEFWTMHSASFS